VVSAIPAGNVIGERARDRYLVDPKDQFKAEKQAREQGLEVLGFYHSHPGHPPVPSSTDQELSWQGYQYLIVGIQPEAEPVWRCWQRGAGDGVFEEVPVVLLP
jgi:proteasome lid subunit RPN8/RPN11